MNLGKNLKAFSIVFSSMLLTSEMSFGLQSGVSKTSASELPRPSVFATQESSLGLSVDLRAQSLEDENLNSKTAGGYFGLVGTRNFTGYLSSELDLKLLLTTGTYTNRYSREGSPLNTILLQKALVDLHPLTWTAFQLGVLAVEFSSQVSSFDPAGFPGVRAKLEGSGDLATVGLSLTEAIPTSSTPEVKSSENGINTRLSVAMLSLGTNPQDKADLTLKISATRFQFHNLTSSAATDSQFKGNTVSAVGSQSKFDYEFAGTEYGALALWKINGNLNISLAGSQLLNELAPQDHNKAQLFKSKISYSRRNLIYTFTAGAFNNESDSLPASYASDRNGNNNRFGWLGGFSVEFEKQKTKAYSQFVQSNVIDSSEHPYQADRQSVVLGMEAQYEIF